MAVLAVYSGINGVVGQAADGGSLPPTSAVNAIGKWDINHKAEASEFSSSATSQATDRVWGNDDWDGNYSAYGDSPAFFPGDFFMMCGFLTQVYSPASARYMSGRSIVDEFSMKLDIEGAKEIEHAVKMSCAFNGTVGNQLNPANTEAAYLLDSTAMNVQSAAGCVVAVCVPNVFGSQTWYVLKDVRSADLTMKTANKAYHSSTTSIQDTSIVTPNATGVWRNWSGRLRGNMDATVSVSQYAVPEELIPNKAILGVRIYTQPPTITPSTNPLYLYLDGTTGSSPPGIAVTGTVTTGRYWELDWVMFQAHSGIEVDRKTANIIGATTNGGLKAVVNLGNVYSTTGGTPTMGRIVPPAYGSTGSSYVTPATAWWPWQGTSQVPRG